GLASPAGARRGRAASSRPAAAGTATRLEDDRPHRRPPRRGDGSGDPDARRGGVPRSRSGRAGAREPRTVAGDLGPDRARAAGHLGDIPLRRRPAAFRGTARVTLVGRNRTASPVSAPGGHAKTHSARAVGGGPASAARRRRVASSLAQLLLFAGPGWST